MKNVRRNARERQKTAKICKFICIYKKKVVPLHAFSVERLDTRMPFGGGVTEKGDNFYY